MSIGIAELTAGETPSQLLQKADEGLYLAKRRGRNRYDCCG
ncbi:MAG: diguanylate cyclase [Firmicutes bacterium]|nr:diguanylate cyclase [Bacillota bacterium]